MRKALLSLAIASAPFLGYADDLIDADNATVDSATTQAAIAAHELKNKNLTSEQYAQIEEQKKSAVQKIETVGTTRADNASIQLKVSKSLASVEEAPRAIPYAERGLALAEKSGDPTLIRSALLAGSEVYYKAGKYELSRDRAQRILKNNPKDKDALMLYMQVKDRASTPSATKSGGAQAAAPALATTEDPRGQSPAPKSSPALTNAASLEAQRHLATGWSRLKLDPAVALKSFDVAVAADAKNASVRTERAKARLIAGDAKGSVEDATFALSLQPNLPDAYAARAEANRALGKADAELIADYEKSAQLDTRFTGAYQEALTRIAAVTGSGAATPGSNTAITGRSAPDSPRGMSLTGPKGWGIIGLICASLTLLGGMALRLVLKRRSDEDGSPSR